MKRELCTSCFNRIEIEIADERGQITTVKCNCFYGDWHFRREKGSHQRAIEAAVIAVANFVRTEQDSKNRRYV